MNARDKEDSFTLEILDAIDAESNVSQRHLARHLGIALGLANSYLKRCVKKGFVKIQQAPANRYIYYLTPKGFAEKSRLTAQYLTYSFDFYRQASESCIKALRECSENGWKRVILCGVSELGEIASLRASDERIELLGTYDPLSSKDVFVHLRVWQDLAEVPDCQACLVTTMDYLAARYSEVSARFGEERVLVPELLRPVMTDKLLR